MKIPGYKLVSKLGAGGMATVYVAVQESLHRQVAFKVMAPHLAKEPGFAERFMREARIVAKMQHPHIVSVFDVGGHQGVYYLAMELLTGGNLAERLKNKQITPYLAAEITRDIADALQYAHQKNIIHRDIKPDNILFRESTDDAVLSDFGIAKALDADTQLTQMGSTVGTPKYMSPEQARGADLDGRSDLYSLGIMLYEMLTGKAPFIADDAVALAIKHMTAPIPQLPDNLARYQPLINKLLAKEPKDRFASGAELAAAITQMLNPKTAATKESSTEQLTSTIPHLRDAPSPNTQPYEPFFGHEEQELGNWFNRKYDLKIRFSADSYDEFRSRLQETQEILKGWISQRSKKAHCLRFEITAHPWIHGRISEILHRGRQENTPLGELINRIRVLVTLKDDLGNEAKEIILAEGPGKT